LAGKTAEAMLDGAHALESGAEGWKAADRVGAVLGAQSSGVAGIAGVGTAWTEYR
jgi:hypothetical protein